MSRNVLGGLISVLLLGFFAWSMYVAFIVRPNGPIEGPCSVFLSKPEPRWMVLEGCVLDVQEAVVESAAGDFEPLANRGKGLSSRPYAVQPTWLTTWIPIKTKGRGGPIKAVFRVDAPDLMKWVNALEAADDAKRERLWADQGVLKRVSLPGVLSGKAERPGNNGLQHAMGSAAAAGLLLVTPGKPPPPELPWPGVLAGVLGLVGAALATRRATGAAHLEAETTEQLLSKVSTSDVKLELGALDELRREDAERRRKGPPSA